MLTFAQVVARLNAMLDTFLTLTGTLCEPVDVGRCRRAVGTWRADVWPAMRAGSGETEESYFFIPMPN